MEFKAYMLLDAVEQNKRSPRTFPVPARGLIAGLKVGDVVKICVKFDPKVKVGDIEPEMLKQWAILIGAKAASEVGGERFWVTLTEVTRGTKGDRTFNGIIDNDLVYTANHGLALGQEIAFDGRNILACVDSSEIERAH